MSLTYINLSYCEHVTDAGVELLGMILSLISIDISGCLVQDQGISALGNNSKLKDVIIAECSHVTDIGIQVGAYIYSSSTIVSQVFKYLVQVLPITLPGSDIAFQSFSSLF